MQKFKHVMKELQGAVIIGSAFQAILGYSGLMSVLVRYDFGMFIAPHVWNSLSANACFSIYQVRIVLNVGSLGSGISCYNCDARSTKIISDFNFESGF